jgi:class 3 adenylate cyclase/putative methionine-R-sulfoxide reductase with GAF domain
MPIKTSKEIIGVLTLSRKDDKRIYSHEDVEALTPLLSNAAFTYENLRLLKENAQGTLQLKSIEKIFKIINSSFRDSELLQAVLSEIRSVVPYDIAVVMTRDNGKADHVTVFDLLSTGPTSISKGASYFCGGSLIEKSLKQESTIIINDTPSQILETVPDDTSGPCNDLDKELFTNQGRTSCLLTPLRTDGVVTGILALSAKTPGLFDELQNLMEWIANGLSLAIESNRLSAAVVKRDQELETIKQIGSVLASSTFDMDKVLKYMKIGQGIAGHVAARGESLLVVDTQCSPHFFPGVDQYTGFKTRSALCVPMISKGKVIGVIEVLNKNNGVFSSNDEDLLQSIATSVSIAIENARLYKEKVSIADHERGIRRMFQKFVPKEVLDSIIHGEETGKGVVEETKTLTLLNLDIRGFTELAMEMGPQKTVYLLNSFFSLMGGIVFKFNGIVDKYLGDGFLAIFGAPVSSIRDADNAAAAALEMKQSLATVNKKFIKEIGTSLNIGISVHTGEVVVGNIGFEKKMDYTVIGHAVNTVFRLQELARSYPNGIIIGENTCRAN